MLTSKNDIFNESSFINYEIVVRFLALKRVWEWSWILILILVGPARKMKQTLTHIFYILSRKIWLFCKWHQTEENYMPNWSLRRDELICTSFKLKKMTSNGGNGVWNHGSVASFPPIDFLANQWWQKGGSGSPRLWKPRCTTQVREEACWQLKPWWKPWEPMAATRGRARCLQLLAHRLLGSQGFGTLCLCRAGTCTVSMSRAHPFCNYRRCP